MFDKSKAAAVKRSIHSLADEYLENGLPDVALSLRKIADLPVERLVRLSQLMAHDPR